MDENYKKMLIVNQLYMLNAFHSRAHFICALCDITAQGFDVYEIQDIYRHELARHQEE
jgi:vancomycin permeability regulator SanA